MFDAIRKPTETGLQHTTVLEVFDSATEFVQTLDKRLHEPCCANPKSRAPLKLGPADMDDIHESWKEERRIRSIGSFSVDSKHPFGSWKEDKWKVLEGGRDEDVKYLGLDQKILLDESYKIRIKRDYAGAYPCVPAHLAGKPKAMYRPYKQRTPSRTATFLILDVADSDTSAEEVHQALARQFAKVVDCERKGIRTNVYVAIAGVPDITERGTAYMSLVKLKDSGSVFSPKRLAWALTATAFLRVYGFNWTGTQPNIVIDSAYGYPLKEYNARKEGAKSTEDMLTRFSPAFFRSLGNFQVLSVEQGLMELGLR